jgi:hypothetical protein
VAGPTPHIRAGNPQILTQRSSSPVSKSSGQAISLKTISHLVDCGHGIFQLSRICMRIERSHAFNICRHQAITNVLGQEAPHILPVSSSNASRWIQNVPQARCSRAPVRLRNRSFETSPSSYFRSYYTGGKKVKATESRRQSAM